MRPALALWDAFLARVLTLLAIWWAIAYADDDDQDES